MPGASGFERPQLPPARDALEPVGAAVAEAHPRACDQVGHGAGDEDLSRISRCSDPGCDVHCDPRDPVADHLDFAGVQAQTELDTQGTPRIAPCSGARERTTGPSKGGEEPIPCRVDLVASVLAQHTPQQVEVSRKKVAPAPVAYVRGLLCRPDDVGE